MTQFTQHSDATGAAGMAPGGLRHSRQFDAIQPPPAALEEMFDLSGKTALVVGGYGGLGGAIARGLASRGARLAVAGRDAEKASDFATDLPGQAIGIALDGGVVSDINRGVDHAAEALGGIDILVNCVGINIEQYLLDVTEAAFDQVYATNLKSAMFLGQAAARHQIAAAQGGKQIHMLSVSSHRGFFGKGYTAYCATKGALIMLVRQHALELAPHNIQVNGVAPTYVATDMIRKKLDDPDLRSELTKCIPMGRIPEPEDVSGTTVFLASPAAGFVTGQVIYVDGGVSANR